MQKMNLLRMTAVILTVICLIFAAGCEAVPTQKAADPTPTPENKATPAPTDSKQDILKINGGADDAGIYAIVVRLKDTTIEKGEIELVYYGEKGSPQENSIVNTFIIQFYMENGMYEIRTLSDGEEYSNRHKQSEMKFTHEFGANLRAGYVIISFTPDGGEKTKLCRIEDSELRS